jgi:multidrug efflux pump subunit AcrB
LLAIVLSVGPGVDDAIVVVENIERHLHEGLKPLEPRCEERANSSDRSSR